jgi:hypothetical protein
MKKIMVFSLVSLFLFSALPMADAQQQRGGLPGLLVGCCFGIRTAGAYNEGKDLHFRDWGRIIPVVGLVLAIWDGIEGAQGITTSGLQAQYGAQYF